MFSGDYVILSVEKDEVYDQTSYKEACWHITDERSTNPLENPVQDSKACQSVMILAPNYPKYDQFSQEVVNRSSQKPFNLPNYNDIGRFPGHVGTQHKIRVPIYAGLAHDAVMLLARGMTDVMRSNRTLDPVLEQESPSFKSGELVMQELRHFKYQSK